MTHLQNTEALLKVLEISGRILFLTTDVMFGRADYFLHEQSWSECGWFLAQKRWTVLSARSQPGSFCCSALVPLLVLCQKCLRRPERVKPATWGELNDFTCQCVDNKTFTLRGEEKALAGGGTPSLHRCRAEQSSCRGLASSGPPEGPPGSTEDRIPRHVPQNLG